MTSWSISCAVSEVPKPSFDDVRNFGRTGQAGGNGHQSPDALYLPAYVDLATVKPQPLEWLWPGRIPKGKLTLICGDPSLGKSMLTMDLVARCTIGSAWPDIPNSGGRLCRNVILLAAEDDVSDTIRPRLEAAGGNVGRVTVMTGVTRVDIEQIFDVNKGETEIRRETELAFLLSEHLDQLERLIEAKEATIVIVDPLNAYLDGTDTYKDSEVRSVLQPLVKLAARLGVTVIAVMHLTKKAGGNALYRVSGSMAFIATARAAHLVAADQTDSTIRLFLPLKMNLARMQDGLKYQPVDYPMVYDGVKVDSVRINWLDERADTTADEALAEDVGKEVDKAMNFLREILAKGPARSKQVDFQAAQRGISSRSVDRAAKKLNVRRRKLTVQEDAGQPWEMSLPTDQDDQPNGVVNLGHLGDLGHLGQSGEITDMFQNEAYTGNTIYKSAHQDPLVTRKGDQGDQEYQGDQEKLPHIGGHLGFKELADDEIPF